MRPVASGTCRRLICQNISNILEETYTFLLHSSWRQKQALPRNTTASY